MKFGYRTPSFKKSFKARTTGRLKREMKRSINPFYGKKGMGWINNPKKAMYNKVYNKTTRSIFDSRSGFHSSRQRAQNNNVTEHPKRGQIKKYDDSVDNIMTWIMAIPVSFLFASWLVGWIPFSIFIILSIISSVIVYRKVMNHWYSK